MIETSGRPLGPASIDSDGAGCSGLQLFGLGLQFGLLRSWNDKSKAVNILDFIALNCAGGGLLAGQRRVQYLFRPSKHRPPVFHNNECDLNFRKYEVFGRMTRPT